MCRLRVAAPHLQERLVGASPAAQVQHELEQPSAQARSAMLGVNGQIVDLQLVGDDLHDAVGPDPTVRVAWGEGRPQRENHVARFRREHFPKALLRPGMTEAPLLQLRQRGDVLDACSLEEDRARHDPDRRMSASLR